MTPKFEQVRNRPPLDPKADGELIVACPQLRTNANFAAILRTASCCGLTDVIVAGQQKVERKVARDGADEIRVRSHRSLLPVLGELKREGFALIGLEQTTNSVSLYDFAFPRKSVLVVGTERGGIPQDQLDFLDHTVEIPVFGLPHSFNVATATSIAIYEFRRQYQNVGSHFQ